MDRSDIYSLVWIVFLYLYMIIIRIVIPVKQQQDIAGIFGIVILFGGIFIQDYYFMMKTAPYPYIKAYLRPSPKKGHRVLHIFIKKVQSKKLDKLRYATTLTLAFGIKHHTYEKFEEMVLQHEYAFEKRITFEPGMAVYQGYVVKHPNVATAIFYEYPEGAYDIDHANPIPVFRLKDGPGDYWLNPIILGGGVQHNPTSSEAVKDKALITRLTHENVELRREAHDWHQKAVELGEYVAHLKNELVGVLKSKTDVLKAAWELMFLMRREQATIENAIRGKKKFGDVFGKWMMYPLIIAMVLGFVALQPDLRLGFAEWISVGQNQFFLVVIGAIIVAFFYYGYQRKK